MKYLVITYESKENYLSNKIIDALHKNQHEVIAINLLDYAESTESFKPSESILSGIKDIDKVYICTHGIISDTTHCYYEDFLSNTSKKGLSAHQLSHIAEQLLKACQDKTLPLELIMCYGARTSDYKADHNSSDGKLNYLDSFAYRLFAKLHSRQISLDMNAYINAVSVENNEIVCEDEQCNLARQKLFQLQQKQMELEKQQKEKMLLTLKSNGSRREQLEKEVEQIAEKIYDLVSKDIYQVYRFISKHGFKNYGRVNYRTRENLCHITLHSLDKESTLYSGKIIVDEADILSLNSKEDVVYDFSCCTIL